MITIWPVTARRTWWTLPRHFARNQGVANPFATENDVGKIRERVKLARDLASNKGLDTFRGRETAPGPECRTDARIDVLVRRTAMITPELALRRSAPGAALPPKTLPSTSSQTPRGDGDAGRPRRFAMQNGFLVLTGTPGDSTFSHTPSVCQSRQSFYFRWSFQRRRSSRSLPLPRNPPPASFRCRSREGGRAITSSRRRSAAHRARGWRRSVCDLA